MKSEFHLTEERTHLLLLSIPSASASVPEEQQGVLGLGEPAGEAEDEAGDLVRLLHVQLVLLALVGLRQLHHAHRDLPAEVVVELRLLLQADLLGLQHLDLLRDAAGQRLLLNEEREIEIETSRVRLRTGG